MIVGALVAYGCTRSADHGRSDAQTEEHEHHGHGVAPGEHAEEASEGEHPAHEHPAAGEGAEHP